MGELTGISFDLEWSQSKLIFTAHIQGSKYKESVDYCTDILPAAHLCPLMQAHQS